MGSPKPKKTASEAHIRNLEKGRLRRDEIRKQRISERTEKEAEAKVVLEERIVKKAICIKKKQLKKEKVIELSSDDDDIPPPLKLKKSYSKKEVQQDFPATPASKIANYCIYVKISAGQFGQTKIFNTRNYNYYNNGVKEITERLRKDIDNKSGAAWYSGYQKLRPNMKNDGKPESYYLDMILFLAPRGGDGVPQSSTSGETRYVPSDPQKRKVYRKEVNKVNNKLDKLFGKLQKEKDARTRANRQIRKDDTKLKKIVNKKVTPRNELKLIDDFALTYQRAQLKLKRYFDKGLINQAKYDKALNQLRENYNKFNP